MLLAFTYALPLAKQFLVFLEHGHLFFKFPLLTLTSYDKLFLAEAKVKPKNGYHSFFQRSVGKF